MTAVVIANPNRLGYILNTNKQYEKTLNRRRLIDSDAQAFITAVEAADGTALEDGVKLAYSNFVRNCKADGIWNAIKACCIMAGARTLAGALVPLVGPAPTNFNFVSGDYNRKTGLVGDGTSKYLDANRNNNADPQNSKHLIVRVSSVATSSSGFFPTYIGRGSSFTGASGIGRLANNGGLYVQVNTGTAALPGLGSSTGFIGASRSVSASFDFRAAGETSSVNLSSQSPFVGSICVFNDPSGGPTTGYSNARLSFYSIGESLDLALLDARVTALVNSIAAALP